MFNRLLATKFVSLSNQKCTAKSNLINLYPNECTQGLCFYPFVVNLDRCVGSCNTFEYLYNKVCVPNKTEDFNLCVFSMMAGINESKILTKQVPYKCTIQI